MPRQLHLEQRHFVFIAKVLANHKPSEEDTAESLWVDLVKAFTRECKATNEKFNSAKFKDACGFEDE